jgi:putative molybdopterin biosynthesis protein
MSKEMLTTRDLAEYLRINENQIYRLIQTKKLPAARVTGKWLFPKQLIEEWIMRSARESVGSEQKQTLLERQVIISGSNDLALELLAKNTNIRHPRFTASLSSVGSLAGLVALRNGTCHIAAAHLLDVETGEYNNSYIKRNFSDLKVTVLNLTHREQGLVVKRGNPLGIRSLKDLVNKKVAFINRQEGAGTRVLLDYRLKENNIEPLEIAGYGKMAYTHMEVALEVLHGTADAGIAIRAVAQLLGLDFIPLATERFDLVIPNEHYSRDAVKALCEVLRSDEFKISILRMGGYELYDTGRIMYERG